MGAAKLLTAAGGAVILDAASTATDKTLTLPANNGTVVYKDSSGNVGIGTDSPSLNTSGTVLHINNSNAARAAMTHYTNAESGSGAAQGLIVGKWSDGTNYIFDYGASPVHIGSNGLSRIVIDASGRTRLPYQPSFSAHAPTSTGSAAIVKYTSTRSNVGSHYDTSTGVYTAPIAGVYVFTFNALMNVNGEYCRLLFRWNGTSSTSYGDTLIGGTNGTWNSGWSYLCVGLTWVISLGQGDTVSVWNDGPTTTYGANYGTFSGYMLG